MWNATDFIRNPFAGLRPLRRSRGLGPALPAIVLILLILPWTAVPSSAQEGAVAEETEAAIAQDGGQELREELEDLYEILPVRDGILLRPREEYRGVRAIEIADGTIAINGEEVPEEAARGWLGSRADAVLAVAALAPEERGDLFELAAAADGPPDRESAEAEPAADGEAADEVEPPAPPPAPEERPEPRFRRGTQTAFGSNVHVGPDEEVEDVVVLGGGATIEGLVTGDAVVFGGRLDIEGEVEGSAAVIGGSMSLGPHSVVGDDVAIVGGSLHREPGARIGGSVEQVDRGWDFPMVTPPTWRPGWHEGWHGWSPWSQVGELFWTLGTFVLCGLLIAMVLAIGRNGIQNLSRRIGLMPFKAGLVGLLIAVLLVPVLMVVSFLLLISIIGIPIFVILLLAFIFLGVPGLMVIGLVGYTAVSHRAGRWLAHRFGWTLQNPFVETLVGLAALFSLIVIGRVLGFLGGPVDFFAALFVLTGWAVQIAAWLVGFGAVFIHLWERREPPAGREGGSGGAPPSPREIPPAEEPGPEAPPPQPEDDEPPRE